jgi:endonuclease/exonuclease/phosphatase family metal-dependent hydrolase
MRSAPVVRLDPGDWSQLSSPVEVVNVHMYAPHVVVPKFGLPVRRRQIRDFERFLATEGSDSLRDSRVLVGDFNATPLWPVYRWFAGRFTDAASAAAEALGHSVRPTWGPWHGAPRLLRIDHAFLRGFEVENFQVMAVRGSDHSAVVLDLRTD